MTGQKKANSINAVIVPFHVQIVHKTFSEKQSAEMNRYTILNPADRKEIIMLHLQAIDHNKCETIRAFGLQIDGNFVRVPARQLEPPIVEYHDCKMIKPKNGGWSMNYGCDNMEVLSKTGPFSWAILNTDPGIIEIKLKQFANGV